MNGESGKIWYLFDKGAVSGPFDLNDLKKMTDGGLNPESMVWSGGQTDWQTVRTWGQTHLGWGDVWYVAAGGLNHGPLSLMQVSEKLRLRQLPLGATRLWTSGLKQWVNVYEVSELTRMLGIQRRKHPRVPLVGDVRVQGLWWRRTVPSLTLSTGGLGIGSLGKIVKVTKGNSLSVKICSELLAGPVNAKAQVLYMTDRSVGLQFTDLAPEGLRIVTDYVRTFQNF